MDDKAFRALVVKLAEEADEKLDNENADRQYILEHLIDSILEAHDAH
jgi:hypothetical protein